MFSFKFSLVFYSELTQPCFIWLFIECLIVGFFTSVFLSKQTWTDWPWPKLKHQCVHCNMWWTSFACVSHWPRLLKSVILIHITSWAAALVSASLSTAWAQILSLHLLGNSGSNIFWCQIPPSLHPNKIYVTPFRTLFQRLIYNDVSSSPVYPKRNWNRQRKFYRRISLQGLILQTCRTENIKEP